MAEGEITELHVGLKGTMNALHLKDRATGAEGFRMADDLLESYIVQHIEASPKKLIFFSWHGDGPTLPTSDQNWAIDDM